MKINELFKYGISALVMASASSIALAKVPQVGDVIDANNVNEYADYLIESSIELIKKRASIKSYTDQQGRRFKPP
jgi:hypothetical protein